MNKLMKSGKLNITEVNLTELTLSPIEKLYELVKEISNINDKNSKIALFIDDLDALEIAIDSEKESFSLFSNLFLLQDYFSVNFN